MSATLETIIDIVARQSGVKRSKLNAHSAIDQDVRISGDDIDELAEALAERFGDHVQQWQWHRFAELNETNLLVTPYFVWRLIT